MKSTTLVLVILLSFLLLVRLFFYFNEVTYYKEGDSVDLTHSFFQEPKENSYGQYFFTSNLLISIPSYPKYYYGDKIRIQGIVDKRNNENGSLLIVENPKITQLENDSKIILLASFMRDRIEEVAISTIPPKEAGLFLGIILGVRDRIEEGFYDTLRSTGVLHIIAASGQNVSILASILMISFASVVKRKLAIIFTAGIILFYCVLVGFDPPIVRASIMAMLSLGAVLLGRQSTGLYTLSLTGWCMVMFSPHLIADISFQLSFLSTFGIITLKPLFDNMLNFMRFVVLKEDISTTISAQVATLPLMLSAFGSYSLVSLLVNTLVLWTIPPIMFFGILALFASAFSPIMATPFILLSFPFLSFFTFIIDIFANPGFEIQVQDIPETLIIGYYLILIVIVIRFQKKERRNA